MNIVTGGARHRCGARRAPGRRQDRVHRIHRSRQEHPARRSPARGKKVTLELGGKAANIVFEDAALDQAVEGIVNGIFFNQGHVCCAGSRLLVQESVAEVVLDKLRDRGWRRCAWAIRSTRTPTSARSTAPSSCSASKRCTTWASPKARSRSSPTARSPTAGTGSVRRCSRTCRSRIASRARRSSGRC